MINVSRSWKGVASVVALFAGLMFSRHAHAIEVGGSTGYAINKTSEPCWAMSGDRIQYTGSCGPSQTWTIPLVVANAGSHSVAIGGTNNSTLACYVCEMNQDASTSACNPTPNFPAGTSVQSGMISVPGNGGLYVLCFVGQGSAINTLNYTQ